MFLCELPKSLLAWIATCPLRPDDRYDECLYHYTIVGFGARHDANMLYLDRFIACDFWDGDALTNSSSVGVDAPTDFLFACRESK